MISQPLTSQDFVMSQVPQQDMPSYLLTYPALSRLDNLIITNFKSFQQQTFTGPFLGFTSIIGPNGSGKSNVLDALMFCLCGENLKHNFFDLRQYINRDKAQTYRDMSQKKKKCIVQANFLLQNDINLSLKRQIDAEGAEIFFIDYNQVPRKIYENFLFRHGINPQIPNYAITQGQIDKLLMRQPLQLSHYIESLSGSVAYKREYDNTKSQIDQISRKIVQTTQKISKLKGDKKNAKNINLASKQCEQLEQEYQEILKKLFTLKVHIKQLDIQNLTIEIQKKKHQQKQRINEINKRKLQFQQQMKQKQQLNKQMNICQRKIIQLRNILKGMSKPDQLMKIKEMETYERQVKQIEDQIQFINSKKNKLKSQIPQVHGTQIIEQYLNLFSQWQNKNRTTKLELDNKRTLYFNLQAQHQFQRSLLDSQMERQNKQKSQVQKRKNEITSSKAQITQINEFILKLKKQSSQSQSKYSKSLNLLNKQKEQYERFCNQVENLQQLMTQSIDNQKDKQIIKRLGVLQGFYGQVQQKIRPTQDKYIIAFSILTSSISKYLLAKDQKCSKLVANKLKDMNSIKTLIILSNIKNNEQKIEIRQSLGKLGLLALDIIDFQKNIQGFQSFLKSFVRGKVICDDLKTAFQIRNKRIPGVKEIITLDGQVLKSDGMITSYGNTQNIKKSYKLGSNKKSFQAQLRKAIQHRDQIKQKIQKLQKDCRPQQQIRRNNQIVKLQRTKQQLNEKIQYLSSIKPKQIKSLKNIINDISIIQQKLSKVSQEISLIQKSMSKQNYISEFMKKHRIQNLQSFRSSSNLQVLQKEVKQKTKLLKQIDQLDQLKQVYKKKHQQKKYKFQQIKEQLKTTQGTKSRNNIEKDIQKQEQKLKQLRQKIAKLAVFKDMNIQLRSNVIEMEAKFKFTQQKHRQFIKDLQAQYGIMVQYPISKAAYKQLQDYIASGSLGDVSRKRLQKGIKDLQNQKQVTQQKLQKLNSIDLLQKNNHSRKQTQIVQQIKTLSTLITSQSLKRDQLLKSHQTIKTQRKNKYLDFFQQLKITLSRSYQILTEIRPDLKGKADLYLENSQLPFDYGVYFTPTPPTKRFVYDLEQLSGGQKSIASLALQYALAITSKAPFFILDQSDAFLDTTNSQKLLNLVKNSFKDKNLQIILITHKPSIYQKCESLVGVTRPKHEFSQVFSMKIVQNSSS